MDRKLKCPPPERPEWPLAEVMTTRLAPYKRSTAEGRSENGVKYFSFHRESAGGFADFRARPGSNGLREFIINC